ncbi:hypothetical protein [Zunongwangia sp. H14]|uniref:hypothetical protein n=1 Tax=Zunongwangia sp. H14 TaxID=3240792 RepID=UPI003563C17A
MKKLILVALTLLFTLQIKAQEETIELLRKQLVTIQTEEKNELKQQIQNINSLLENGVISAEEAEKLKNKAAESRARKIEERQGVILKTIAFLQNQASQKPSLPREEGDGWEFFLDVDSYFKGDAPSITLPSKRDSVAMQQEFVEPQPPQLQRREVKTPTTLDLVAAFGFNNAIGNGNWQELEEERDYALYSSHFLEIGIAFKTPLTKENWLRIKYGLSYQNNGLEPTNNRFFTEVDGQTQLQSGQNITGSGFRVNNLVLPLHLEIGPTKLKQDGDKSYFSAGNQLKIAAGGYIGINLNAYQWVEQPYFYHGFYWVEREKIEGYNTNKMIYGLSAYAGVGAFSIYGKYDLNTIFKNGAKDQQFLSLGLRLDL